jgi:hypothetical protein
VKASRAAEPQEGTESGRSLRLMIRGGRLRRSRSLCAIRPAASPIRPRVWLPRRPRLEQSPHEVGRRSRERHHAADIDDPTIVRTPDHPEGVELRREAEGRHELPDRGIVAVVRCG